MALYFSGFFFIPSPPRVPLGPSHLQAFGSVDGPERSEHPQDPQDLHHGDGAGPGGSLLSLPRPQLPAPPPGPPLGLSMSWDRGASRPGCLPPGSPQTCPSVRQEPLGASAVFPHTAGGDCPLSTCPPGLPHTPPAKPCHSGQLVPAQGTLNAIPGAARCPPTNTGGCPTHSSPMEMRDTATTTRSRMLK